VLPFRLGPSEKAKGTIGLSSCDGPTDEAAASW